MAWKTAPHCDAPQGVLCFAGDEPGTVQWYEDKAAPPPERRASAEEHHTPTPTPTPAGRRG